VPPPRLEVKGYGSCIVPGLEDLMPRAWSAKDERQYEHIKDSAKKKGRTTKRAKQIAAATVNKQRSSEGRTRTQGGRKTAKKGRKTATRGRKTAARGRKK
jgi:hypothetical protein